MTGRSNSATTSRMMWMLSASRARRWSSLRVGAVVVSGAKASVLINCRRSAPRDPAYRVGGGISRQRSRQFQAPPRIPPKTKARDFVVPGFDLSAFARVFGVYPNSWTVAAGTSGVLIQQHAQGQQVR